MKKIFVVAIFVGLTIVITSNTSFFSRNLKPTDEIDLGKNANLENVLGLVNEDEEPNTTLKIVWHKINDVSKLKLIPNFTEKLTAREVKEKYNCNFLTNGGFYTTDYKPIGLFITDSKKQRDFIDSPLTNGVLSINDFQTPRITSNVPQDNLQIALQNGPVLFDNGFAKKLSIKNDKPARRMVAATTGANELVFIAFYNPGSNFDGPLLSELPVKLEEFEKQSGIQIADAINLDGGSASVFFNENSIISEVSPVGSFFCEE